MVHEKGNINPCADFFGRLLPSLRRIFAGLGYDNGDDDVNLGCDSTASVLIVAAGA